jgi:hypothetical protein
MGVGSTALGPPRFYGAPMSGELHGARQHRARGSRPGSGHAAVLVAVALVTLLLAAPAIAGAATAGNAEITRPGQATPLDSGGSATSFGVALPAGASCPGDTAHQGYHVYSYLVPEGISPTAVSFKTGLPSKGYGYFAYGAYYGAINTAEGTGQITSLPAQFTLSRLSVLPRTDLFPHGAKRTTWESGIACADTHGVVTNYWNAGIVLTASASDSGGFTWKVIAPPPAPNNVGLWVGVGLVVVAVGLGITAFALSRRRRTTGRAGTGPPAHEATDEPSSPLPTPAGR